jgi:diguanylate cyclase (GGDEF)-like protein/PAS domain S-box-containing protein
LDPPAIISRVSEEEAVPASRDDGGLTMLDALNQPVFVIDGADARITSWNGAAATLLGYDAAHAVGRDGIELLGLDRERVMRRLALGKAHQGELRMRRRDGGSVTVAFNLTPQPDGSWIIVLTDLAESVEREELFRRLFDEGPVPMLILGTDLRIERVNAASVKLFRYAEEEMVGKATEDLVPPRDLRAIRMAVAAQARGELDSDAREFPILRGDGTSVTVKCTGAALRDERGQVTSFLVVAEDLTDRNQYEAELLHHARFDVLTGLMNRASLSDELDVALNASEQFALLLLDLDAFKDINDTLGHAIGDRVLGTVAERLAEAVREHDRVARFGGDEFAVIVRAAQRSAARVAEQLLDALEAPVTIDGVAITVRASMGIVHAPQDATDADTLLRRADTAMHRAKRDHTRLERYLPQDEEAAARRLELAGELPAAIAQGQLEVHYQPTIDFATGGPGVVEALVRWRHPRHGLIPPLEFVPLALQYGLGGQLFDAVLAESLTACRAWRAEGLAQMVGVNVSPATMLQPNFVGRVATALTAAELPAAALGLELTEDAFAGDSDQLIAVLRELTAVGVRLAIDDFGTGYSSLSLLAQLPVRTLKLDRLFCHYVERDPVNAAILSSTVELAHRLGLRAVIEGIESEGAFDIARDRDFDAGQGYWICRPIPAADVLAWLRDRAANGGSVTRLPARRVS